MGLKAISVPLSVVSALLYSSPLASGNADAAKLMLFVIVDVVLLNHVLASRAIETKSSLNKRHKKPRSSEPVVKPLIIVIKR